MSLRKIQLYILTSENEDVIFMIIEACYNVPMINEYRVVYESVLIDLMLVLDNTHLSEYSISKYCVLSFDLKTVFDKANTFHCNVNPLEYKFVDKIFFVLHYTLIFFKYKLRFNIKYIRTY